MIRVSPWLPLESLMTGFGLAATVVMSSGVGFAGGGAAVDLAWQIAVAAMFVGLSLADAIRDRPMPTGCAWLSIGGFALILLGWLTGTWEMLGSQPEAVWGIVPLSIAAIGSMSFLTRRAADRVGVRILVVVYSITMSTLSLILVVNAAIAGQMGPAAGGMVAFAGFSAMVLRSYRMFGFSKQDEGERDINDQ